MTYSIVTYQRRAVCACLIPVRADASLEIAYLRECELQFTAGVIHNNGMLKLHKAPLKMWQECLNILSVKGYS